MDSKFICHIGYNDITDLISEARNIIMMSLPNIHDDICHSLVELKKKNDVETVKIILDNSEDNFRNGFGEIKAVEMLRDNKIDVLELKGNLVSFIICDELGFFLFPQSRIFASDDDLSSNAVQMTPFDAIRLKNYFFYQGSNVTEYSLKLNESIVEFSGIIQREISSFDEEKEFIPLSIDEKSFFNVKTNLEANPPLSPDFKRQIQTYTTKIQFVELKFEGANIHSTDIKIPPNALPFKDEDIKKKLMTKMKLFSDIKKNVGFNDFLGLKSQVDILRDKYLTPVSSRKDKSIIKVQRKKQFLEDVGHVKKTIAKITVKIRSILKNEMLKSKKQIKEELRAFLLENPPEHLKGYNDGLFDESIDDEVNTLIDKIKFPEPDALLGKISLNVNFYDLTFEDFRDENLLKEFKTKRIMDEKDLTSIVEMKKAFEAKK